MLPKSTLRTVEQAGQARTQARNADRVAIDRTRRAAIELARQGISMRDTATILGISHQRVHQLLAADDAGRSNTGDLDLSEPQGRDARPRLDDPSVRS